MKTDFEFYYLIFVLQITYQNSIIYHNKEKDSKHLLKKTYIGDRISH